MKIAANNLEFEVAARIRDRIRTLLKTREKSERS
jgi:excinuclease UvrABC nuclease subunit